MPALGTQAAAEGATRALLHVHEPPPSILTSTAAHTLAAGPSPSNVAAVGCETQARAVNEPAPFRGATSRVVHGMDASPASAARRLGSSPCGVHGLEDRGFRGRNASVSRTDVGRAGSTGLDRWYAAAEVAGVPEKYQQALALSAMGLSHRLDLAPCDTSHLVWSCWMLAAGIQGAKVRRRMRSPAVRQLVAEMADTAALLEALSEEGLSAEGPLGRPQKVSPDALFIHQARHHLFVRRQQLADIIHAPRPPPKSLAITKPAVNAPQRARSFGQRPPTSPERGSSRHSFRETLPDHSSLASCSNTLHDATAGHGLLPSGSSMPAPAEPVDPFRVADDTAQTAPKEASVDLIGSCSNGQVADAPSKAGWTLPAPEQLHAGFNGQTPTHGTDARMQSVAAKPKRKASTLRLSRRRKANRAEHRSSDDRPAAPSSPPQAFRAHAADSHHAALGADTDAWTIPAAVSHDSRQADVSRVDPPEAASMSSFHLQGVQRQEGPASPNSTNVLRRPSQRQASWRLPDYSLVKPRTVCHLETHFMSPAQPGGQGAGLNRRLSQSRPPSQTSLSRRASMQRPPSRNSQRRPAWEAGAASKLTTNVEAKKPIVAWNSRAASAPRALRAAKSASFQSHRVSQETRLQRKYSASESLKPGRISETNKKVLFQQSQQPLAPSLS
ncbi:hypothetical protein WJX84_000024 [Apatococcus fuscideae]|uniref:Uncharacterized protein n=1 Tax=Apatococcus fuscideae TaxID=2026836 RepID=A0AAW1TID2_9CHLO